MKKQIILPLTVLLAGFAPSSFAVDLYWDVDGATSGLGGSSSRSGTWGVDAFWSTSASGTVATTAWPGLVRPATPDNARFQGGSGTITLSGTQTALIARVTNSGTYTFTGGVLNLETANFNTGLNLSAFDGDNGNSLVVDSDITLGADAGTGTREIIFTAGRTTGSAGTNTMTLNGSISAGSGARATTQLIQLRPQVPSASGTSTIIQNTTSVISNGSQTVSVELGTRVAAANSGRVEIKGNNTYGGNTRVGSGTTVIYGDAINSVAGALGNNANAIDIGFGQVISTSHAAFLINGARTVGKAINIGNGAGSITDYAVTIGGETAHTGTFSGNIDLDGANARTTKVSLTAAAGGTVIFSGSLGHGTAGSSVPIEKVGDGTVILSRAGGNGYQGGTTVAAGTLLANNTSNSATGSGAVSVSAGATLGGKGFISGATTINGTGTIQAGAGVLGETLTLSGDLNLNDNSRISLTLGGSANPGQHTTLARTGSGTWVFDSDQAFTFSLISSDPYGSYSNIITGLTGSEAGLASIGTWQLLNLPGGYTASFSYDAGNVSMLVVPEPASALILLSGAGMLALVRRRRQG